MNRSYLSLLVLLIVGCAEVKNSFELPVLGRPKIIEREVDGKLQTDTVPHRIAEFAFVDQDSNMVTNQTFDGKIYVADFFFTSCPTICPVMKQQMLRVYEAFEEVEDVALLSHSIDPEYDTVALLKDYATRLGIETSKWHMVTGDKEKIYEMGETSYMVVANEDDTAPGGFIHSGAFLLIDKDRQIRGVYDGTKEEDVDLLIKDINWLIASYAPE